MRQLARVLAPGASRAVAECGAKAPLVLGLFFQPEAFVTATRQAVAQAKGWSLDEMRLGVDVLAGGTPDTADAGGAGGAGGGVQTFLVKGLHLQGAGWALGALSLSDDVRTPLATCRFRWRREEQQEAPGSGSGDANANANDGSGGVSVPVYLNEARTELLFEVTLPAAAGVPRATWRQRGAAAIAWV